MSELSGRPKVLKRLNSDLIKNALKGLGSATKAQLAQETGVSLTTVGLILTELVQTGEILNKGLDESSGGRRAERYTLNLNYSLAAALCVEDKYIDYAIGNIAGEFVEEGRAAITESRHMEAVRELLDSLNSKYNAIRCIGVGVPAAVYNGCLFTGTILKEWYSINVQEYLEEKYNVPVVLENDLNAIAAGYAHNRLREAGLVDSSALNMVYIHFNNDGTGAGVLANGKLIRGFSNFAGELGYLQLGKDKSLDSLLNGNISDEEYAETVALAISALSCTTNPEYVVVGGNAFRFDTVELVKKYCSHYIKENVRPEIIPVEDSDMDYISGVMKLAIEEMNWNIRLIKSRNL